MARNNGIIYLAITAVLTVFFFTFSGCSDSINSPFSPDALMEETALTGGGGEKYAGVEPSEEWESFQDKSILRTRDGETLSTADITLEYDDSSLPPGVEFRVVFTDPNQYEFHIVPEGHALNTDIRVTIDYSKADLDKDNGGGNDDGDNLVIFAIEGNRMIEVDSWIDAGSNSIGFDTNEGFARYALARD